MWEEEIQLEVSDNKLVYHSLDVTNEYSIKIAGFSLSNKQALTSATGEFVLKDKANRDLILYSEHTINEDGTLVLSVYAKYWMRNWTGLPLFYQQRLATFGNRLAAGQSETEQQPLPENPQLWYNPETTNKLAQPFMYSYGSYDLFGNKTAVTIASSKWSKAISIESIGTDGQISVGDDLGRSFELGVRIEMGSGAYHRTKMITFTPKFILINKLERVVFYGQQGTNSRFGLEPNQKMPFHWREKDQDNKLQLSLGSEYTWSAPFSINEIGEFCVKIARITKESAVSSKMERVIKAQDTYLVRVEVQLSREQTIYVILKPEAKDCPPYLIENLTDYKIRFWQKNQSENVPQELGPNSQVPYTWDLPSGSHSVVIEFHPSEQRMEFNLDKIKTYDNGFKLHKENGRTVWASLKARGPTRVLCLTHENLSGNQTLTKNSRESGQMEFRLLVEIRSIGLSIIDHTPQEFLYASFKMIRIDYRLLSKRQEFLVVIWDMQIDNQLMTCTWPILLSRVPSAKDNEDFCQFLMIKSREYSTIDFFHAFSFMIYEMDLKVDDEIINKLVAFVNISYLDKQTEAGKKGLKDEITKRPILADDIQTSSSKNMYFHFFNIHPVKCNISFCLSGNNSSSGSGSEYNFVKSILGAIGVTVAGIENAPIGLNTLILKHSFNTRNDMIQRIGRHYRLQLLAELYKILGSFDLIGNPVSLVHNLGTGVHDFFYEPALGLVTSPRDFMIGLGKGSTSLVKHSVAGIFNTASKITGSLGKGIAQLSFDPEYVKYRERVNREKPKHVADGLSLGFQELFGGFSKGIAGILKSPMQGAKQEGVGGFLKGVGRGVIGVAIKPGVGLFDMGLF